MRHCYLILPLASLLLPSCGELVEDTGLACVGASGDYIDGLVHEIEVWLGPGHGDSWDIECEATITGDHELTITASFKWKKDNEADGEPDIIANCETPPLGEGLWDVHYGDGVELLKVEAGQYDSVCVDSGRER